MSTEPSTIAGRYRLERVLGTGSHARTWLAYDLEQDEMQVAVKELPVGRIKEWKQLERFKREAEMLEGLAHEGIPSLHAHFVEENEQGTTYYIIEDFVDGQNLGATVDEVSTLGEREARDVMRQLLTILSYLHGQSPPVVHRDIKPSNVMRRRSGQLVLVDFGAVREAAESGEDGSTVVGTFGYMPPEQMHGRVSPASDIYALAATICHLVCGKPPQQMPVKGAPFSIGFREHCRISPALAELLDDMLTVEATERPSIGTLMARLSEVEATPVLDDAMPELELVGVDAPVDIQKAVAGPRHIDLTMVGYAFMMPPKWRIAILMVGLMLIWTGVPGVLLMLIGMFTTAWSVREGYANYELLAEGTLVPAKVTSLEETVTGYAVEYAYGWNGGRYEAGIAVNRDTGRSLEVGGWIQISVDPDDPLRNTPLFGAAKALGSPS